MKELVSRIQAAEILGISTTALDRYRDKGRLNEVPTTNYGIYFERKEVQKLKRSRTAYLKKQAKKKAQAEKPAIQNQISHENNKS